MNRAYIDSARGEGGSSFPNEPCPPCNIEGRPSVESTTTLKGAQFRFYFFVRLILTGLDRHGVAITPTGSETHPAANVELT